MRVRYSPRAIEALEDIRHYISKNNASAAWVVASFIRQSIDVLTKWPYRGRATEKENIRRLVVTNYPYVVYYHLNDERVLVLTVMHTAQDREP